ncbi:MAG: pyridoxamine 5'-phosphate oxidase [Balneolaceae bacterium]|nr:pyridoxamine 5'-phosphate oxidase [Balneolaceae bacterium]
MNRSTLADSVSQDLSSLRERYTKGTLEEGNLPKNPINLFRSWLEDALQTEVKEPNAMALATVDEQGNPNVRYVLMKGLSDRSLRFYTNFESRKAGEIEKNPNGSVVFWWGELERQVRIRGEIKKLPEAESEAYFKSRPQESQIGAWASRQSRVVESREELEKSFEETKSRFSDGEIPKPPFWGGYELVFRSIEFWQGRPGRMHDRVEYLLHNKEWTKRRLAP